MPIESQPIRKMIQNQIDTVKNIGGIVQSRFKYGSPLLFTPSQDLGIPSQVILRIRQERVKNRRQILGLEYRER